MAGMESSKYWVGAGYCWSQMGQALQQGTPDSVDPSIGFELLEFLTAVGDLLRKLAQGELLLVFLAWACKRKSQMD